MNKSLYRIFAFALSLLLALSLLTACGDKEQKNGPNEEEGREVSEKNSEQTKEDEKKPEEEDKTTEPATKEEAGEPLQKIPVATSQGDGFVMDLPAGYTYDENWYCYVSPDKDVHIWTTDGSLFEEQDNFEDAMSLAGQLEKKVDLGDYEVSLVRAEDDFLGATTHYFINFKGKVPGYYGAKIHVSSGSKNFQATETQDILNAIASVRKLDAQEGATTEGSLPTGDPFKDFTLHFTTEETSQMSNFINYNQYLVEGDTVYGCGFLQDGNTALVRFQLVSDGNFVSADDMQILVNNISPSYLFSHEDWIYYLKDQEGIYRIKKDGSGVEEVLSDAHDYLQKVGDKMYFTDKAYTLYSANLDGSDSQPVFDKTVYYPYFVTPEVFIYQDDADGETLHLYHLPTKTDAKLCDKVGYNPIVAGSELFFVLIEGESNYLAKMDLSQPPLVEGETMYPLEVGKLPVGLQLAISPNGHIFNGENGAWMLEDWRSVSNEDQALDRIYKYFGPTYSIYWTFTDVLVEDVYLELNATGGAQTMPRFQ